MIPINPMFAIAAFAVVAIFSFGGGYYTKAQFVKAEQVDKVAEVIVQQKEIQERDYDASAEYQRGKTESANEYEAAIARLRADVDRLRKRPPEVRTVTQAIGGCDGPQNPGSVEPDRTKLAEALERFGAEQLRIAREADDAIRQLGAAQQQLEARSK